MPEVQNDMVWVFVGSPWGILALWLALINLTAFLAFGVDKLKAKRGEKREGVRRIPEKTLFLLAGIGGSIGALLGMRVWHHKTLHKSFRLGIPAMFILQVILVLDLYLYIHVIR